MKIELKDKIFEILEAPLLELGAEIADMNLSQYKQETTLRLFVYASGGVTLDVCAKISRAVGDLLDETDFFEEGYLLEVSSPGLDRPLTKHVDYKYRVGEKVKIEFKDKKRKKINAEILGINGDDIDFLHDDIKITVPITEIEKGKIIF